MYYYKLDTETGIKIIKRKDAIRSTKMASKIVGEEVKKVTILSPFGYWRLKTF